MMLYAPLSSYEKESELHVDEITQQQAASTPLLARHLGNANFLKRSQDPRIIMLSLGK